MHELQNLLDVGAHSRIARLCLHGGAAHKQLQSCRVTSASSKTIHRHVGQACTWPCRCGTHKRMQYKASNPRGDLIECSQWYGYGGPWWAHCAKHRRGVAKSARNLQKGTRKQPKKMHMTVKTTRQQGAASTCSQHRGYSLRRCQNYCIQIRSCCTSNCMLKDVLVGCRFARAEVCSRALVASQTKQPSTHCTLVPAVSHRSNELIHMS
jgi:hypothetical protein